MCKIDVEFCNSPDLADHIEQMIFGLREAAPDPDDDDEEEELDELIQRPRDPFTGY